MAVVIAPRRTGTGSKVPTTADLMDGEIAVNYTDGKVYQRIGSTIHLVASRGIVSMVEGAGVELSAPTGEDVIISLDAGTVASLNLADTAVQPADLDDYQPLSSTLTELSSASPTTNQVVYWTSPSTVSTFNTSTGGRALVNIGSVSSGSVPYFTSSSVVTSFTTTATGRSLLNVNIEANTTRVQNGSGGWNNLRLQDGEYTPTITGVANFSSSSDVAAHYMRVGNEVTVAGSAFITPTAAGNVIFRISLPFAASFSDNSRCSGMAGMGVNIGTITANVVNNIAQATVPAPSSTTMVVNFQFTYRIA